MQTTHHVTLGTIIISLGNQLQNTFNAYHINVPNILPFVLITFGIYIIILLIRRITQIISVIREEQVFLEITPPAFTQKESYTTKQLFLILHDIGRQLTFLDRLLGKKCLFSFEIVSTRKEGIRYIIRTTASQKETVKRAVVSYLPQVHVEEVADYIPSSNVSSHIKIGEFALSKHFAFPLAKQNVLEKHDPIAYITGMMTKLEPDEIIAIQIVTSPTVSEQTGIISNKILRNENVLKHLKKSHTHIGFNIVIWTFEILLKKGQVTIWGIIDFLTASHEKARFAYQQQAMQSYMQMQNLRPVRVLSTFEQDVVTSIQEKMDQPLFETSIRTLVVLNGKEKQRQKELGLKSALAVFSVPKYQSIRMKYTFPLMYIKKLQVFLYRKRLISLLANRSSSLLSASEIADLYHFPFTKITQTENIAKIHAKDLPTPISLKSDRDLDVIFAKSTYDEDGVIGLSDEERAKHMYLLGQTGSGKSTIIYHMAKQDIEKGRGVAVIDPHGDLAKDLLYCVPNSRINEVIYFNPFDLSYPIGINLLELPVGLTDDELELEKELVCESVISIFRRLFSKKENDHATRIEYILRNTIHTSFSVKDRTIFTVYKLLTNRDYRNKVIENLEDENLKGFWKDEFGIAGDFQVVKMIQGVTTKIGRFLFSPTAKRVMEQKISTINFDDILNQGKILICNLSEGKIGEDTSQLFGTMIISKIYQAAIRRERMEQKARKPFYLFVDEFQYFATTSFTRMLSGGRKFGLRLTIAEQSSAQQEDRRIVNVIITNTGTVGCFRIASPVDEQIMLHQFAPYIARTDIVNLPKYKFYIKISASTPEEPFSGFTLPIEITRNEKKLQQLIDASRKNYANKYIKPDMKKAVTHPKKTTSKNNDTEDEDGSNDPDPSTL